MPSVAWGRLIGVRRSYGIARGWGERVLRRVFAGRLTGIAAVVFLAGSVLGAQTSPSVAGTLTATSARTTKSTSPRLSLNGASCAAHSCIVVGEQDINEHVARPFAERWAGGVWKQEPIPQPSRTTMRASALNAVSCWSARGCVAVGYFFPSCCQSKAFAEEWTGSSWKLQRYIGPHVSPGYQLNGVFCPSARDCIAVGDGSNDNGSGNTVGLVEQWYRGRWIRDPSPNPKTTPGSGQEVNLTAVSCADQSDCVAIGSYSNGLRSRPLAESYENGTWSIRSPKAPKGFSYELASISCPTSTLCVAVGLSTLASAPGLPVKKRQPLAELWDGHTWRAQRLPNPAGSLDVLDSVSCPSPKSCTALGQSTGSSSAPFAEHWNGRTWRRQEIAILPQITDPGFIGISCTTSRTCTAVGAQEPGPFVAQSVSNHWTIRTQT
jgi:hypothetical protein